MGYTHYWDRKNEPDHRANEQYDNLVADARAIIDLAERQGIRIADGLGQNVPLFMYDYFALNGDGFSGNDHESFIWTRNCDPFGFCKTAHKPYDAVVTAILIRAKVHYGDSLQVDSDGNWNDWQAGAELCQHLWGNAESPLAEVLL